MADFGRIQRHVIPEPRIKLQGAATWPSFSNPSWLRVSGNKRVDKEGQKYNVIFINKVIKPVIVYCYRLKR